MTVALMAGATVLLQRALGWPGIPGWLCLAVLPMVWIVGPALLQYDRRWTQLAILLGLAWDLLLEPVVGPGGVAWSAAALALSGLAGIVADRSTKAWFVFGAAGTVVLLLVRAAVLMPLGLGEPLNWRQLLLSTLLTALWCGLVGWVRALDVGARWSSWRARRLR